MIRKIISGIIAFALLLLAFNILINNFPQSPVKLVMVDVNNKPTSFLRYGSTPVFAENLRFSETKITYFIEPTCNGKRKDSMKEAFRIFEEEVRIISFEEVNRMDVDILVGCSDEFIQLGDNLFAAGEGGPSQIINTTEFKTITQGRIFLYEDPKCIYPVVELHELFHVFGFDHSVDPSNIMSNISRCDQTIPEDMFERLRSLYSVESLPDVFIKDIQAIKNGRYLDFNITVLNGGLDTLEGMTLSIISNSQIIESINIDEMDIGYGRNLKATNIKLPSTDIDRISFVLDYFNEVNEINKENNIVELSVSNNKS